MLECIVDFMQVPSKNVDLCYGKNILINSITPPPTKTNNNAATHQSDALNIYVYPTSILKLVIFWLHVFESNSLACHVSPLPVSHKVHLLSVVEVSLVAPMKVRTSSKTLFVPCFKSLEE